MMTFREKWIAVLTVAAAAAAATLGVLALRSARYEIAVRRAEAVERLAADCSAAAERGAHAVRGLTAGAEDAAADLAMPELAAYVRTHPPVTRYFIAAGNGALVSPSPHSPWGKRFAKLFRDRVRIDDAGEYALVLMPRDLADLYRERIAPERNDAKKIVPPETFRKPSVSYAAPPRKTLESLTFMKRSKAATTADAAAPRAASAPPAVAAVMAETQAETVALEHESTRFAALIRGRERGYVPFLDGSRFTPLVWARNRSSIVGFELDAPELLQRAATELPETVPPWVRLALIDGDGRTIRAVGHAAGAGGEPVRTVPFAPELLPAMRLEATFYPKAFPTGGTAAVWLATAALLGAVLFSGAAAWGLARREFTAARRKSSFAAQVSHEFRTPLTGLRMYAELLRDHPELPPAKRERYCATILGECARLDRMIGNVLDFGRLAEKRQRYRPEKIELSTEIPRLLEPWRDALTAAGLTVRIIGTGTPFPVTFDRDALTGILGNLTANAAKYAAGGGAVEIRLDAPRRELHVRDFGPGIPPRLRRRIFEEFFRADDTSTAVGNGFGLGLAIARNLARDQGTDLVCRDGAPGADFVLVFREETPV